MNEYFFLSEKVKQGTAFAYTQFKTPIAHELIAKVKSLIEMPFELVLKKVEQTKSGLAVYEDISDIRFKWVDYQPNNLAWPIMSERMKNIINDNLSNKEKVDWLKVKIKSDDEARYYFIPRFNKQLDVLNLEKTLFVNGTNRIIKPVFSLNKISQFSIFHLPVGSWEITSGIYISRELRNILEQQKISGVGFESISIE